MPCDPLTETLESSAPEAILASSRCLLPACPRVCRAVVHTQRRANRSGEGVVPFLVCLVVGWETRWPVGIVRHGGLGEVMCFGAVLRARRWPRRLDQAGGFFQIIIYLKKQPSNPPLIDVSPRMSSESACVSKDGLRRPGDAVGVHLLCWGTPEASPSRRPHRRTGAVLPARHTQYMSRRPVSDEGGAHGTGPTAHPAR